ncbi:hypothetical protein [Rugamonas sp. DEMB1]|uniref:hypothetical protein n=1 Tax=Rugamonas sp. DEMB1 TaxID=3039386 RepID=UPI00244A5337|nr:hypothetical protein [Rugamonas sp. DEMB1]WGG53276.1 hypothetical protein QC826_14880 [Rugamonas sp. DEMB1]
MSEIIENGNGDHDSAPVVSVGDANSKVSLKIYQDVYHQINGRTEEVRKRYAEHLLVEFNEIEQLHHKIMQLCDVHNVVASNEVVSIFHDKERKEQFTSFERFKLYNTSSTSPTLNFVMRYNFSIIPAGLQRTQEYIVTVKLTSRVAVMAQMEADGAPVMYRRIFAYSSMVVAEITVEYADYIVARGFIEAFDEWVKGCKASPSLKWLDALQKISHGFGDFLMIINIGLMTFFSLGYVSREFGKDVGLDTVAKFILFYSSSLYIFSILCRRLGAILEYSVDNFPILSYLKLNRGDENVIDKFRLSRRDTLLRFVFGSILAVVLGIISTKIEKLM